MAIRITRAGVGLTVGIIILAAGVLGGLYYVQQRGEQARREEAIQIAEENLQEQSDQDIALNEPQADSESSNPPSEDGIDGSGEQGTSELPQTGAEGTVFVVAVAGLTFAVTGYVASRRALAQHL